MLRPLLLALYPTSSQCGSLLSLRFPFSALQELAQRVGVDGLFILDFLALAETPYYTIIPTVFFKLLFYSDEKLRATLKEENEYRPYPSAFIASEDYTTQTVLDEEITSSLPRFISCT